MQADIEQNWQLILRKINDLKIQAMIFDMDIDIEKLELVEKSTYQEPKWLKKWKDKQDAQDYDPYFDEDR